MVMIFFPLAFSSFLSFILTHSTISSLLQGSSSMHTIVWCSCMNTALSTITIHLVMYKNLVVFLHISSRSDIFLQQTPFELAKHNAHIHFMKSGYATSLMIWLLCYKLEEKSPLWRLAELMKPLNLLHRMLYSLWQSYISGSQTRVWSVQVTIFSLAFLSVKASESSQFSFFLLYFPFFGILCLANLTPDICVLW